MYKVMFEKSVDKFLMKHKGQAIIFHFEKAIEELCENPYNNNLDIDILKGGSIKYRLRLGQYRFLYEIIENEILIIFFDAGTRGDIYKKY